MRRFDNIMDTYFDKITQEALKLSVRERGILATRLLESMDASTEKEIRELWLDLAESRLSELDEGRVSAISEDEVERKVRARLS